LLDTAIADGRDYVEFMLHSSELMPGGSPTFSSMASIERLYRDIERLFEHAQRRFGGQTLREYYDHFASRATPAPAARISSRQILQCPVIGEERHGAVVDVLAF